MRRFRRATRYYLLRFLRLRGAPWKVALGFALGSCINFYPTFGIGVLLAGLLASAFRVSITAAVLGDLIFKTFFPVFFYFNLLVGNFLLGQKPRHIGPTLRRLIHLSITDLEDVSAAFFMGSVVNTLILGGILTAVVYILFTHYRHRLVHFVYHLKK